MQIKNLNNVSNVHINNTVNKKTVEKTAPSYMGNKTELLLSKNKFEEALVRKYHSTGFFQGFNTMEGSINDKVAYIKTSYVKTGFLSGYLGFKGTMGNENVDIKIDKNQITGLVGEKEINLTFDPGLGIFREYSITGTIGEKKIDIRKEAPVENSQGENDILALVASLLGYKLKEEKGQFASLELSQQSTIDKQIMMNQQMMDQQMMNLQMMNLQMMDQQRVNQQIMMTTPGMGFV